MALRPARKIGTSAGLRLAVARMSEDIRRGKSSLSLLSEHARLKRAAKEARQGERKRA